MSTGPLQPKPEQDLELARTALAADALVQALDPLAGALAADPLRPETLALAERLLLKGPENAASLLVLPRQGAWWGTVALRAWLLGRTGNLTEALCHLYEVACARPGVPYLEWARGWVARPEDAARVEPRAVAACAARLAELDGLENHPRTAQAALDVLAEVRRAHPEARALALVHARLARAAGKHAEALAIAQGFEREHPGHLGAMAVAQALRALGRAQEAQAAFARALVHQPDDVPARLDLADLLWEEGQPEEALGLYEQVLALEPGHPWALPSALLLRVTERQEPGALAQLRTLVRVEPENERAQVLLEHLEQELGECDDADLKRTLGFEVE